MHGNFYAGQREMLKIVDEADTCPDDHLYRAVIQCSDPEATAWAAGTELSLPGEEIVRNDEYGGDGEPIRRALQMCAYHWCAWTRSCRLLRDSRVERCCCVAAPAFLDPRGWVPGVNSRWRVGQR